MNNLTDAECKHNQCNCGKTFRTARGFHIHFVRCEKRHEN